MAADVTARPFVIRDPVHGYVRIAAHERLVVDHPITQRLRRVNQTGLTELVFPEARTSRLAHSLGAMHMASRILIAALENAEPDDARAFLDDILSLQRMNDYSVDLEDFDALQTTDGAQGGVGLQSARVAFRTSELRRPKYRRVVGLLEAALRLAALFHDLGHLPFSHDFELALHDAIPTLDVAALRDLAASGAPHEEIGHKLAHLVFRGLVKEARRQPGVDVAYQFARDILNRSARYDLVEGPNVDALGWLHSLIDGEIDADRADFLLRDGRALGFDFAQYDLERLLGNITLVRDADAGYITAVREHGLSAAESFFLARSRSYQAFTRHHKVVQIAAALRYATSYAVVRDASEAFRNDLVATVSSADDAVAARELLRRFAGYDDVWWLNRLRDEDTPHAPELVRACLALVLRRERTFYSVWKRRGDVRDISTVNALVADAPALIRFEERRRRMHEAGVLALAHRFKPYTTFAAGPRAGQSVFLVVTRTGLRPVSELSALIDSLDKSWRNDLHIHVFALGGIPRDQVLANLGIDM